MFNTEEDKMINVSRLSFTITSAVLKTCNLYFSIMTLIFRNNATKVIYPPLLIVF